MHVRRGFLGWGVFFILAGAVPLAVRAGYLDQDQIGRLWTLWPLILIGIGVGLVLGRTHFAFIGGLIVAATLGLMVGGLLSSGMSTFSGGICGGDSGASPFAAREGAFPTRGSVALDLDCGTVTVAMAPGTAWRVEGKDQAGSGPEITSSDSTLRVRSRDGKGSAWFLDARETWRVTLPTASQLDLDLRLNAGQATVDLAGAALGAIDVQLNAGAATIDLGSATEIRTVAVELNAGSLGLTLPNLSMTGSIKANAGSVRLCTPPGAGLKVQTGESILGSYDYGSQGLVQDGKTWTTPGFDAASVQIELRTEANAGSFTLNPEAGCD
jgi:hypothetical protein